MGTAEFSSGDTKASMEPSRDNAMWLTSPGVVMANCIRPDAEGPLATNQVATATAIRANAIESKSKSGTLRGNLASRAALLGSVPESALSAKDRSLAD